MEMKIIWSLLEEIGQESVEFDSITILDENTISVDGDEYRILDEDEVREALEDHIHETASYFNPSFLANMTDLPEKVFEALTDENEAVYELIQKTCGIDEFIDEAVRHDGVGHFLSSYDGNEIDLVDGYTAFRI